MMGNVLIAEELSLSRASCFGTKKNRYQISLDLSYSRDSDVALHACIATRILQLLQMSVGVEFPVTKTSKGARQSLKVDLREDGIEVELVPGLECAWSPQPDTASKAEPVQTLESAMGAADARLDQVLCTDSSTGQPEMVLKAQLVDKATPADVLDRAPPADVLDKATPTDVLEKDTLANILDKNTPEAQSFDSEDSSKCPRKAVLLVKRRAGKPSRQLLERACPGSIEACFK